MDSKLLKQNNELLEKLIKRHSFPYRFVAGLFSGLGATIGLALVITLIGYILSRIQPIPIIGSWLSDIINEALGNIQSPLIQPLL